jgi:UDP-N-acetylmuramate: L-alanyl-gamma-D-glutamyl-meso-diaminopimelate ligase
MNKKKIHFIAIGGSAMHNLAIALKNNGNNVSGSDDEIFEPSRSNLEKHEILPLQIGWFPEKITKELDFVVLGMHARKDNPELLKAQELGLKVYSYPEFIYSQSTNKQRIVIAGSHGKTTITSMILHVLKQSHKKFDYLVGAKIDGFETMVKLSDDASVIVIEGDEYLSSPIDSTSKFIHYQAHVTAISGIAWDHMNVFPTFESYKKPFETFINNMPKGGCIIYNEKDAELKKMLKKDVEDVTKLPYTAHPFKIKNGKTQVVHEGITYELPFFGEHNMMNLSAALGICGRIGISKDTFYQAIKTFKGASGRLQLLGENASTLIFKDFAHAPSKVKATTEAVKKQFLDKKIVACLELHTFSSLNKDFIVQYKDTLQADLGIVYFDPHTLEHKKLPSLSTADVQKAFNSSKIKVINSKDALLAELNGIDFKNKVLLLMSSGNFGGVNLSELTTQILQK